MTDTLKTSKVVGPSWARSCQPPKNGNKAKKKSAPITTRKALNESVSTVAACALTSRLDVDHMNAAVRQKRIPRGIGNRMQNAKWKMQKDGRRRTDDYRLLTNDYNSFQKAFVHKELGLLKLISRREICPIPFLK